MKPMQILPLVLLVAVTASNAQNTSMPMKPGASASAKSSMPLVDGEVRKIDPATGQIVLKHGDIPNLAMPAMTMGYVAADKNMLKNLKVGDKVKFQAQMIGGNATVTELRPAR